MNIELLKAFEEVKNIANDLKVVNIQNLTDLIRIILTKIPINIVDFHNGRIIERAVNNNIREVHYSISRLSYKPKCLNDKVQRASLKGETMFYASTLFLDELSQEQDIMHERIIGCSEANVLLRENIDGENNMTFGKWEVSNDIALACFINPYYNYDSKYLTQIQTTQNQYIEKQSTKEESIKLIKDIYSFISNEFSKTVVENYEYIISALISDFLVSKGYGIYYPSVQVNGQGMCVAITPNDADEKLEFKKALLCRITKSQKEISINNLMIGLPNNGNIHYFKL